jgi:hypothetical protein
MIDPIAPKTLTGLLYAKKSPTAYLPIVIRITVTSDPTKIDLRSRLESGSILYANIKNNTRIRKLAMELA